MNHDFLDRPKEAFPSTKVIRSAGVLMHVPPAPAGSGDQSEPAGGSGQLASCFWCERAHHGEHPLSVCSVCSANYSTLCSLEMSGSYPLSDSVVDEILTRVSPGNFALGYMDGDSFSVFFVGRSDSDVRERLHEWVGMPSQREKFASNAKAPWSVHHRALAPLDSPVSGCVGNADSRYTHFAYSYADSPAAAFEKELRNFGDFGGCWALDNQAEPVAVAA